MQKDTFLSIQLKFATIVSLAPVSGTAVLFEVCVVHPESTSYRNFKIEPPESSPAAIRVMG